MLFLFLVYRETIRDSTDCISTPEVAVEATALQKLGAIMLLLTHPIHPTPVICRR